MIDNLMDAQANAMNAWMDSAKKFQSAFTNGNVVSESQNIYKDMFDKQATFFGQFTGNTAFNPFSTDNSKPEEILKNWYNQQMNAVKQMTDFNQSIYNSMVSYGKNVNDYNSNFSAMNNAWTNIYNSWMNTMNTSYETFSKNINNPFNKDMFKNMFEGNKMYINAQEYFQPMINAIKNSDFSVETWKNIYSSDNYKKMTEQMFGAYFTNASLKEVFDNASKQINNFFVNQNGLGKEYFAQVQNMTAQFPDLFSGNSEQLKDLYSKMNNVFSKSFEPVLKLVNPGKEKDNVEATIALLDKVTEYSIKQSELQSQLYKTMQTSMEELAKETQEKYKNFQEGNVAIPTPNELYNEWVKKSEKTFSDLFATDEFSKVKADALSLSMDVKKQFEKQFENIFEFYPLTFKSEMEEVYKTIHELKKTVKELQTKLAMQNAASVELFEDEKGAKAKKK